MDPIVPTTTDADVIPTGPSDMNSSKSKSCPTLQTAPTCAVQCSNCKKWRVIPSQEQYETIRENIVENPFTCEQRDGRVSCQDEPDLECGADEPLHAWVWGFDKPSLPKSPPGLKRKLSLRHNLSRVEVYYETPTGKMLRRPSQVPSFLSKYPEFNHISPEEFDSKSPKITKD